MLKGIHLMDQGNRRHKIEQWNQRIKRWAAKRMLNMDATTMSTWGRFYAKHHLAGRVAEARPRLRSGQIKALRNSNDEWNSIVPGL
jgi:hypothetical protein